VASLTSIRIMNTWVWVMLCALLVAGCGRLGGSQESAEEEEKTAQVTVWSDRFEIFLEHRLVVVNTPTKFITHVTDLTTLEPRREGPLTFILRRGSEEPTTHVEPTPARDGIYIPELTFPKPGEWIVSLVIPSAGQEYVVELPPLTVFATHEEMARTPDPAAPEGISFLKEQQWKLSTKTEPVHRRQAVERVRLAGVVSVRPGYRAAVTPPIAGHLMPPPGASLLSLGARVTAGQVLAMVQPHLAGSDLVTFLSSQQQLQALDVDLTVKAAAAEAEAIRARVAFNQAEQVLRRIRALREQNAKSARELEEAEFDQRKAEADLSAAEALRKTYERAKKQLADRPRSVDLNNGMPAVELKAPIAGVIIGVSATVGEHVHSDGAVFTILNPEGVLIEAQIPEADLSRLGSSRGATYETSDAPGTFAPILGHGGGRLVYLGTTVDPKTRTVPLMYEVPNPDGRLRIGMALNVYVETAHVEEALVVPVSALVDEDGRVIAFVQVAGETFEKRDLTLGLRDGEFVQVLSGLAEGERVVTKGAYAIRLASVSATIPAHGHAH
jgi:cobalt-zinc-cadmium efflux system membrane fusion protein